MESTTKIELKQAIKELLREQKKFSASVFKEACEELVKEGVFVKGRGVYRHPNRNHVIDVSRLEAHDLIMGNGGRFLTVEFVKKDDSLRVMNCQVLKNQEVSHLGYIKMKDLAIKREDPEHCIRNMNIQTLVRFRTGKIEYRIKT
jgi:hypothetical protein